MTDDATTRDDETAQAEEGTDSDGATVVAQGTFDIVHPGHLHYLRESAALGDELVVIVARRQNVSHKDPPVLSDRQRRDVVGALETVDHARVGHPDDIFVPIEEIDPAVITLGHDQHHDPGAIEDELARRGVDCDVVRVSGREPAYDGELLSSREIIDRFVAERG
jgi:FAD synthetase